MFGFFKKKRTVDSLKEEIKESFDHVKKDLTKVGDWIGHIDGKHKDHDRDITELKNQILEIKGDLIEIKDLVSFFNSGSSGALFKQPQTVRDKQTTSDGVQTGVQTPVQTGVLSNLTLMERAIVWALLNSDMRLSYEDLSTVLGKDKSTIRGQINSIRQKSEGLIGEMRETNGKKRVYIPEGIREELLKEVKVRVKSKRIKNKS